MTSYSITINPWRVGGGRVDRHGGGYLGREPRLTSSSVTQPEEVLA